MLPGASSMKMQQPPSFGSTGRGHLGNRVSSGAVPSEPPEKVTKFSPLIDRKVRVRWPDDNNFYEAVIIDYNPVEGRHALVYDIGTTYEALEWVDLEEISPEDIQWEGEDTGIFRHGGPMGRGINRPIGCDSGPGGRKEIPLSQNGVGRKRLEDFKLLHTDSLIKEVERVFNATNIDLNEIVKAKKAAKGQMLPGASAMKMQPPPSFGSTGRGHLGNRVSSGAVAIEPPEKVTKFSLLIGRKVRVRWPDDNNFYKAVITDYNPVEGRHALVYDIGTTNETLEWVDFEEISPEDIQWEGEDPGMGNLQAVELIDPLGVTVGLG